MVVSITVNGDTQEIGIIELEESNANDTTLTGLVAGSWTKAQVDAATARIEHTENDATQDLQVDRVHVTATYSPAASPGNNHRLSLSIGLGL